MSTAERKPNHTPPKLRNRAREKERELEREASEKEKVPKRNG